MNQNPSHALDKLLVTLHNLNADGVAEEIRRVVHRGRIEKIEVGLNKYEEVQKPLTPESAYRLAAEMLCALIDPILIRAELDKYFSPEPNNRVGLLWKRDLVEGSPIEPPEEEMVSFPDIKESDVQALRDAATKVLETLDKLDHEV